MFQRLFLGAVALWAIPAYVDAWEANIAAHPIVASNLELLDVWLQAEVAYYQQPGVVVGIVYDQKLIYAKGFGFADIERREPVTPDTVFRIGSQSKQFTAIAIMQLHEEGKLAISDSVKKYIPDIEVKNKDLADEPITIEQLLTHTAGLPSEGAGTLHWTELDFPTRERILDRVGSMEVAYAPGRRRKYSNLGYALAGQIVESVSGQSFDDYVKSRILNPLGMDSTTVDVSKTDAICLATGYGRRMPNGNRVVIEPWDARGMTPACGMCSTLKDLAKFLSWQIRVASADNPEVLSPRSFRNMRRAHWVDSDWSGGWGLGFLVSRLGERNLYGHTGQVPGFFSSTHIDPEQKLGVIVLANSMDAQPYLGQPRSIPERIFEFVGSAVERAEKGEAVPSGDERWARLYGRYRNIWEDSYVFNYEGNLVTVNPSAPDPLKAIFRLEPLDSEGKRFRIVDGPEQQMVQEEVVFKFGSDGSQASEMVILDMARFQRIE